jgi:hypothetical protein
MKVKRAIRWIVNPFIWFLNFLSYGGHLDMQGMVAQRYRERGEPYKYDRYDFSKDIKYW